MESAGEESHKELVVKLTDGFGAMLEQVQELARRNTDLQQRLAAVLEAVSLFSFVQNRLSCAMMKQHSSRSGIIYMVVIDSRNIG